MGRNLVIVVLLLLLPVSFLVGRFSDNEARIDKFWVIENNQWKPYICRPEDQQACEQRIADSYKAMIEQTADMCDEHYKAQAPRNTAPVFRQNWCNSMPNAFGGQSWWCL